MPPAPRPDLRLVAPPETPEEITGPIQVIRDEPDDEPEVIAQAPLDIRVLEAVDGIVRSRPRWSQRPPAMAEIWEYSTSGDWTAGEKGLKRVAHGLCVLAAFALTYPIDWAVRVARQKPVGFVLALAVLFVLSKTL